jgi:hypothetical protein
VDTALSITMSRSRRRRRGDDALTIAVGASIATVLTMLAAVYASFMFLSASVFARLMYRRNGGAWAGAGP